MSLYGFCQLYFAVKLYHLKFIPAWKKQMHLFLKMMLESPSILIDKTEFTSYVVKSTH